MTGSTSHVNLGSVMLRSHQFGGPRLAAVADGVVTERDAAGGSFQRITGQGQALPHSTSASVARVRG
jgi:hypothetical protein